MPDRLLVRHLLVIQADMVSEFMDYRVTDLVNDFRLRSAETQDGTSINGDTGGQLTSRLEERRLVYRDPLIQTKQIVF